MFGSAEDDDEGIVDASEPPAKKPVPLSDTKEWRRNYMRSYRAAEALQKRQARAEVQLAETEHKQLSIAVAALRREAGILRELLQGRATDA